MLSFRYETVSSKLLLHDSLVAVNNAFVDDETSTSMQVQKLEHKKI